MQSNWFSADYPESLSYNARTLLYRVFDPMNSQHWPSVTNIDEEQDDENMSVNSEQPILSGNPLFPRLGRQWSEGAEYLYWIPKGYNDIQHLGFRIESDEVYKITNFASVFPDGIVGKRKLMFLIDMGWVIVRDRRGWDWSNNKVAWGWSVSEVLSNAELMYYIRNFPFTDNMTPIEPENLFPQSWAAVHWKDNDPIYQLPHQELIKLGFLKSS
jgi:hypothetical protein